MNIKELKQFQKKIIKKNNNIILSLLIVFIIVLGFDYYLYKNNNEFPFTFNIEIIMFEVIFIVLLYFLLKRIFLRKDINVFNDSFKNVVVYNSLNNIFENVRYDYKNGIDERVIASTNMMYLGDRFSSNDLISGTYKGINFTQSDIHIEEERTSTDKDGHTTTYWVTTFLGRWMIFDFNKNFKAKMQVSSKRFYGSLHNWSRNCMKIKLEDVDFNKRFKIYSENEHEAFYILTPHFMEKIKRLDNQLNSNIMLCFIDQKLHIAINNNVDSFECNPLRKINEEKLNNSIKNDIKLITDFVNELNLDNTLFKEV